MRVFGTKNPDVALIRELAPDLVLANAEENRAPDLDALRAAGLAVHLTFPRRVADVAPMLRALGAALDDGTDGVRVRAAALAQQVETAAGAAAAVHRPPLRALTLVWRRPWMALGAGTYAADLLRVCGLVTPLHRPGDRYPRVQAGDEELRGLDLVLLPSEPYAFSPDDLPAVGELTGGVPARFVDGRLLTWHGSRTAAALAVLPVPADALGA